MDLEPFPAPDIHPTRPPHSRAERARRTDELFAQISACTDQAEKHQLMDDVVVVNMGVADAIVSRYRARGVATEDLQQVAYMALVKAVQHFDPETGNNFLSYCVPTVRGEVRRYFRDLGWMVRPPRRVQEMQKRVTGAVAELEGLLGRTPAPSEIADHLDEDVDDVIEALAGDGCFAPASLDRPLSGDDPSTSLGELLGGDDPNQEAAEARLTPGPLVRRLGERDRRILQLRFFEGRTQQEIADDIGVTQMQVSRLLSRIFTDLRDDLGSTAV